MLSKLIKYLQISLFSIAIIIVTSFYFPKQLENLNNSTLDLMYQFKELIRDDYIKISKYILLVDDNDQTRKELNYSPVKQQEWNRYLEKLVAFNTKTIALYLPYYFKSFDETDNKRFLELLEANKNIFIPSILDNNIQINTRVNKNIPDTVFKNIPNFDFSTTHNYKKLSLPYEEIAEHLDEFGFSNLIPSPDGIIRKVPLVASYNGKLIFSYTLSTLIYFLDIDQESIVISNNTLHMTSTKYNKTFKVPLTPKNEMYIHFFKNIKQRFLQTPLYSILNIKNPQTGPNLSNHLVINISTATGGLQSYKTPTYPFTPGGLIVAAALNTIISELFTTPRTDIDQLLSICFLTLLMIASALFFSPLNKKIAYLAKNYIYILFSLLLLFIYPLLNFLIFAYFNKELSTALPLFYMLLFVISSASYKLIVEDKERKLLTSTLRGFVSKEKMDFLMSPEGSKIMFETREKEVSILLTDIVDFGNWSTFQKPDFIFKTLQKYFTTLEEIVFKHGGTIDKKMGDAMLAFFGDLHDTPSHVNDALLTAINIQKELRKQNFPFLTRIGINSGRVTIGNLGSEKHLDYTAIGKTVNFTKRIEEFCIPGGILLGADSYNLLKDKDDFEISPIEIEVKDQEESLTCYNVSFLY